jgi:succinyl-CoA synthetase alpha subunit
VDDEWRANEGPETYAPEKARPMTTASKIIRNFYRDSVSLMQLSSRLAGLPGVKQASAIMASEANLALLREASLLTGATDAGPNDLLITVEGQSDAAIADAMKEAEAAFNDTPRTRDSEGSKWEPLRSLEMGIERVPSANFALISTPGDYAASEALKALHLGLNVMIFSDNVSGEDEIALKRFAVGHGLMVLGPDCGTAILNGVPLGFANVLKRGAIGVVAASGTGLQQVTCLADRFGVGISQAIGTGGHDLSREVGGITMLQGIETLAVDKATKVIVLISKPPAAEVAERVFAKARATRKQVVVCFLGIDPKTIVGGNLTPVRTLEDAAYVAVALARGQEPKRASPTIVTKLPKLAAGQKYVRGLYSGGTFCYEASLLLGETLSPVYSNTPVGRALRLEDVWRSQANTLVDLGDDVFTRGRPHPMIDHRLRNERIAKEAADPETAVILLDVVLGYGSHMDPAGEIVPVIVAARKRAAKAGRRAAFVGFVCGTEGDPQNLSRQEAALRDAGMILTRSNAEAVRLSARIVERAIKPPAKKRSAK